MTQKSQDIDIVREYIDWCLSWYKLLTNWNSYFFLIPEVKQGLAKTYSSIFFSSKKYFGAGKYAWPSSIYNARLVIKEALYYDNLYDLLLNNPFEDELNLHKSSSSLLNQNTDLEVENRNFYESIILNSNFYLSSKSRNDYFNGLKVVSWDYSVTIISAIGYILQNVYIEQEKELVELKITDSESKKNSSHIKIFKFIVEISPYLFHRNFSQKLFAVLQTTNIFYSENENLACIDAFLYCFKHIDDTRYKYVKKYINEKTLFCFFRVFNLKFIFPNFLIKNMIKKNDFLFLIYMLEVYKLFIEKCNVFKKTENTFPTNFLKQKLPTEYGILFVTDLYWYANSTYDRDLKKNCTVKILINLFPSLDVLSILKKQNSLKIRENMVSVIKKSATMVVFLAPSLGLGSYNRSSFIENFVQTTPVTPEKENAIKFKTSSRVRLPSKRIQIQAKQKKPKNWLSNSQHHFQKKKLITEKPGNLFFLPEPIKIKSNARDGILCLVNPQTKKLYLFGGVHSYDGLETLQNKPVNKLINSANLTGNFPSHLYEIDGSVKMVRAHILPERLRELAVLARGSSRCILVPNEYNKAEESPYNYASRDYRWRGFSIPVEDLIQKNVGQSIDFINKELNNNNLPPPYSNSHRYIIECWRNSVPCAIDQFLSHSNFLNLSHQNSHVGAIIIPSGIYKIGKATTILKSCQLGATTLSDGSNNVKPVIILVETLERVEKCYAITQTLISSMSPIAKEYFMRDLNQATDAFFNVAYRVIENQLKNNSANVQLGYPDFNHPHDSRFSLPQVKQTVKSKQVFLANQISNGCYQTALQASVVEDFGDLTKQAKDPILSIKGRSKEEIYIW